MLFSFLQPLVVSSGNLSPEISLFVSASLAIYCFLWMVSYDHMLY